VTPRPIDQVLETLSASQRVPFCHRLIHMTLPNVWEIAMRPFVNALPEIFAGHGRGMQGCLTRSQARSQR
jgi:hypothetical protein